MVLGRGALEQLLQRHPCRGQCLTLHHKHPREVTQGNTKSTGFQTRAMVSSLVGASYQLRDLEQATSPSLSFPIHDMGTKISN